MATSAIRFELSGKTAMFKKPDANAHTYFTYNNIHKIALLGLLGAIIGLKGHNPMWYKQANSSKGKAKTGFAYKYPEFYEKLQGLKVAIVPQSNHYGHFVKKVQTFNNSVGYASQEEGGNLIVREQWLENPKWYIYLLQDDGVDKELLDQLSHYLLTGQCKYIPYLGKNDHVANIDKCEIIQLTENNKDYIQSLFIGEDIDLGEDAFDDDLAFLHKEKLPYSLVADYCFYQFKEFYFTNYSIKNICAIPNRYIGDNLSLAFF